MESTQKERKPYNPYHLAGGHAAPTLPDKKTIAVFKCYCNHTDFKGGSISISIETVMRETGYSHRAVCYADAVLTSLGRITKKSRGIGGQRGGRQSSITRVYCTEAELKAAGANDENYYGRGGTHGLFKVQTPPIQSARRVHSKRKQDGFKVQRDALEPLQSEPFLPQLIKSEPLKAGASQNPNQNPNQNQPQDFDSFTQGKKGQATPTPGAAGNPSLPVEKPVIKVPRPAPPPKSFLLPEARAKLESFGCPAPALDEITKLHGWSKALNATSNVIAAYETMAMRENAFATKMYKLWMPKRVTGFVGIEGDDSDFVMPTQAERERTQSEAALPPDIRELKAAKHWWWTNFRDDDNPFSDCYERRQNYIQFARGFESWKKVSGERIRSRPQHVRGRAPPRRIGRTSQAIREAQGQERSGSGGLTEKCYFDDCDATRRVKSGTRFIATASSFRLAGFTLRAGKDSGRERRFRP